MATPLAALKHGALITTPPTPESLNPALLTRLATLESKLAQYQRASLKGRSTSLQNVLHDAAISPKRAANRIVDHISRKSRDNSQALLLLRIARMCLKGAVGRVGDRRALRAVAIHLLDHLMTLDPNNPDALCLKGEILMACCFEGYSDLFTPRSVLTEAFTLFTTGSNVNHTLALFLKGRWLLSCEALHKSPQQCQVGRQLVDAAANKGCARALLYLAQRLDTPQMPESSVFSKDVSQSRSDREHQVLHLYVRAAELGDPNAFNDIGSSYAQGYASLPKDFDAAIAFYEAAIRRGSILAYDNLGTHYETGMGGAYPDRTNYDKALYYYREGTKKRCPKCAYNLGAAYEEGMTGVLERDVTRAEKYYIHSLRLADDMHDVATAARTVEELAGLYLTQIKLDVPNGVDGLKAERRLKFLIRDQNFIDSTMDKLNLAIASALRSKNNRFPALTLIVGDFNAKLIVTHARALERKIQAENQAADIAQLKHIVGSVVPVADSDAGVAKRKRGTRKMPASTTRKRRKASG